MAAQEDELKSLKEKNNELVQKVQYWKMTAAQRENEKLELMKEVNELRLKVIRLKSIGEASARKLDAALQAAGAAALAHLVEASGAVARALELAKGHAREHEAARAAPRWSSVSGGAERVHRVPPLMIGGQSIQPVVALSRAAFDLNANRQTSRSPNSTRNVTVRAVPMHMLQDVYIPLTRIDSRELRNDGEPEPEPEPEPDAGDSADDIPFDASLEDVAEESHDMTEEDYDSSRRLDAVAEAPEPGPEPGPGPGPGPEPAPAAGPGAQPRLAAASPLAGPSWRADAPAGSPSPAGSPGPSGSPGPRRRPLEPDSTTADTAPRTALTPEQPAGQSPPRSPSPSPPARVFPPTLRRKRRAEPAPPEAPEAPGASARTPNGLALCSRVLQVLLPKLPAAGAGAVAGEGVAAGGAGAGAGEGAAAGGAGAGAGEGAGGAPGAAGSPCKRRAPAPRFDAPSPNGATERGIVSEEVESPGAEPPPPAGRAAGQGSPGRPSWRRLSDDSDSGSGAELAERRARRTRKPVTYKEKPLNRKLRR